LLPCHVLLHPAGHGLDSSAWGQSREKPTVRTVPTRYKDWYPAEVLQARPAGPATDLFLAARCLVLPGRRHPWRMRCRQPSAADAAFITTCLLEDPDAADDAWALLDDFDELLQKLYGPPKFHPLTLT